MDESVRRASANPPTVTDDHIAGAEGAVKWFDPRKGFGFIVGPTGQDIFAHFTVITGEGFRVLHDGSTVEYDAERGPDGRWKATRIARIQQVEVTASGRHPHTAAPTGYTRSPRR
jgi:CspA family cold shock protein